MCLPVLWQLAEQTDIPAVHLNTSTLRKIGQNPARHIPRCPHLIRDRLLSKSLLEATWKVCRCRHAVQQVGNPLVHIPQRQPLCSFRGIPGALDEAINESKSKISIGANKLLQHVMPYENTPTFLHGHDRCTTWLAVQCKFAHNVARPAKGKRELFSIFIRRKYFQLSLYNEQQASTLVPLVKNQAFSRIGVNGPTF